jgi:predicted NBD/HSP70 family sugar kinase
MGSTQSGASSELRRANVRHLLGLIRQHGPISRKELGRLGELSKPTVQSVVEDLLRADLILESSGSGDVSRVGRGPKPRLVRFNANHALVVGVDVGATKMLGLLSNLDGDILAMSRCATPPNATGRRLDQTVKVLIDRCLEQAGVGRGRLAVATVGTAGVIDRETGSVTFAPQLPGWQGRAIRSSLEKSLQVPVLVESEAHLAMLGESWQGVAKSVTDAVFIQLGVGVGMGILLDGEIYRGAMCAAGEIGYLPIGEAQVGPGPGTFEAAVGSAAFTRHLSQGSTPSRQSVKSIEHKSQSSDGVGPAEIFSRASQDERAHSVIDSVLGYLASGLVSVSAILNPELIILGGGLAASLGPHIARLHEGLRARVPAPPRIELSVLGDQAVAVGAVKRGVSFVEQGLFGRDKELNSLSQT